MSKKQPVHATKVIGTAGRFRVIFPPSVGLHVRGRSNGFAGDNSGPPFQSKVDIVVDERGRMICELLSPKRSGNAECGSAKVAAVVKWTNDS